MKAIILAGGLGTRLSEETGMKPKPMVEIGGKPILWHIMKSYSYHGINDFVICCGYKGYVIKEYFSNYFLHMSDKVIDLINDDQTVWEKYPMEELAKSGEMSCFRHNGFWQSMDTLRDKHVLENLWESGDAPWKKW